MSVARNFKLSEFAANPITPFKIREISEDKKDIDKWKYLNKTLDYRFLIDSDKKPVRFTDTFKSSVIPGQERDASNASRDRHVKMYEQDQIAFKKAKLQEMQIKNTNRMRSATPSKTMGRFALKSKCRSFVDLMNLGDNRVRVTPTYTSSVFDRPAQTPKVKRIKRANVDTNFDHSLTKVPQNVDKTKEDTQSQLTNQKDELNVNKECKTSRIESHDSPFQKYYKEIYGPNPPKIISSRKQEVIASNVNFNNYSNKHGVYENLNAQQRRLMEFDSCMWVENGGNYKSFESTSPSKRTQFPSNISFLNKHTEIVNNTPRAINPSNLAKEQLQSHVLPMTEYPQSKSNHKNAFDALHELEKLKEQQSNMKSAGLKRPKDKSSSDIDFQEFTTDSSEKKQKIDTSLNKNGICPVFNKKSDVLRNGINENKANKSKLNASNSIISLNLDSCLSKNNYFKKKNALNVCNLKRQEFMKSQSDLNNYYGKFINKKIDDFKKQKMDQNLLVQSDFLTHKQKKQRFFEGEDARMNFVDNYRRDQSSSALRDNQADVNVCTLELNSVPDNISVDELKRMLRIPHLVSLKLDSNLLNNVTTGKGKLTFRTNTCNEKDLIIKKLNQIGISSNDFEDVNYLRTPIVKKSQLKQSEEIEKSDCNNQNGNEANQDQNSIDFMHNSQLPFKNNLVTGKVGEDHITPSKQSNFKYFNVNDSKIKRINFCQSKGELFGNTNSSYAKMHMDKLKRDRSVFDKTTKDQKTHNKIASDWTKMQKKIDRFSSNRAIQPKISRYGRNNFD